MFIKIIDKSRSINCSNKIMTVVRTCVSYVCVVRMCAGANLGFSEREANHSSGSLKQGVWGAVPPRSYRILCFMKYRNAT